MSYYSRTDYFPFNYFSVFLIWASLYSCIALKDAPLKDGKPQEQALESGHVVIRKRMTQARAFSFCEQRSPGGRLAVLPQVEDVQKLIEAIRKISYKWTSVDDPAQFTCEFHMSRRYWIGLVAVIREEDWIWSKFGNKDKQCVALWNPMYYEKEIHTFNDENCENKHYFICEKGKSGALKAERGFGSSYTANDITVEEMASKKILYPHEHDYDDEEHHSEQNELDSDESQKQESEKNTNDNLGQLESETQTGEGDGLEIYPIDNKVTPGLKDMSETSTKDEDHSKEKFKVPLTNKNGVTPPKLDKTPTRLDKMRQFENRFDKSYENNSNGKRNPGKPVGVKKRAEPVGVKNDKKGAQVRTSGEGETTSTSSEDKGEAETAEHNRIKIHSVRISVVYDEKWEEGRESQDEPKFEESNSATSNLKHENPHKHSQSTEHKSSANTRTSTKDSKSSNSNYKKETNDYDPSSSARLGRNKDNTKHDSNKRNTEERGTSQDQPDSKPPVSNLKHDNQHKDLESTPSKSSSHHTHNSPAQDARSRKSYDKKEKTNDSPSVARHERNKENVKPDSNKRNTEERGKSQDQPELEGPKPANQMRDNKHKDLRSTPPKGSAHTHAKDLRTSKTNDRSVTDDYDSLSFTRQGRSKENPKPDSSTKNTEGVKKVKSKIPLPHKDKVGPPKLHHIPTMLDKMPELQNHGGISYEHDSGEKVSQTTEKMDKQSEVTDHPQKKVHQHHKDHEKHKNKEHDKPDQIPKEADDHSKVEEHAHKEKDKSEAPEEKVLEELDKKVETEENVSPSDNTHKMEESKDEHSHSQDLVPEKGETQSDVEELDKKVDTEDQVAASDHTHKMGQSNDEHSHSQDSVTEKGLSESDLEELDKKVDTEDHVAASDHTHKVGPTNEEHSHSMNSTDDSDQSEPEQTPEGEKPVETEDNGLETNTTGPGEEHSHSDSTNTTSENEQSEAELTPEGEKLVETEDHGVEANTTGLGEEHFHSISNQSEAELTPEGEKPVETEDNGLETNSTGLGEEHSHSISNQSEAELTPEGEKPVETEDNGLETNSTGLGEEHSHSISNQSEAELTPEGEKPVETEDHGVETNTTGLEEHSHSTNSTDKSDQSEAELTPEGEKPVETEEHGIETNTTGLDGEHSHSPNTTDDTDQSEAEKSIEGEKPVETEDNGLETNTTGLGEEHSHSINATIDNDQSEAEKAEEQKVETEDKGAETDGSELVEEHSHSINSTNESDQSETEQTPEGEKPVETEDHGAETDGSGLPEEHSHSTTESEQKESEQTPEGDKKVETEDEGAETDGTGLAEEHSHTTNSTAESDQLESGARAENKVETEDGGSTGENTDQQQANGGHDNQAETSEPSTDISEEKSHQLESTQNEEDQDKNEKHSKPEADNREEQPPEKSKDIPPKATQQKGGKPIIPSKDRVGPPKLHHIPTLLDKMTHLIGAASPEHDSDEVENKKQSKPKRGNPNTHQDSATENSAEFRGQETRLKSTKGSDESDNSQLSETSRRKKRMNETHDYNSQSSSRPTVSIKISKSPRKQEIDQTDESSSEEDSDEVENKTRSKQERKYPSTYENSTPKNSNSARFGEQETQIKSTNSKDDNDNSRFSETFTQKKPMIEAHNYDSLSSSRPTNSKEMSKNLRKQKADQLEQASPEEDSDEGGIRMRSKQEPRSPHEYSTPKNSIPAHFEKQEMQLRSTKSNDFSSDNSQLPETFKTNKEMSKQEMNQASPKEEPEGMENRLRSKQEQRNPNPNEHFTPKNSNFSHLEKQETQLRSTKSNDKNDNLQLSKTSEREKGINATHDNDSTPSSRPTKSKEISKSLRKQEMDQASPIRDSYVVGNRMQPKPERSNSSTHENSAPKNSAQFGRQETQLRPTQSNDESDNLQLSETSKRKKKMNETHNFPSFSPRRPIYSTARIKNQRKKGIGQNKQANFENDSDGVEGRIKSKPERGSFNTHKDSLPKNSSRFGRQESQSNESNDKSKNPQLLETSKRKKRMNETHDDDSFSSSKPTNITEKSKNRRQQKIDQKSRIKVDENKTKHFKSSRSYKKNQTALMQQPLQEKNQTTKVNFISPMRHNETAETLERKREYENMTSNVSLSRKSKVTKTFASRETEKGDGDIRRFFNNRSLSRKNQSFITLKIQPPKIQSSPQVPGKDELNHQVYDPHKNRSHFFAEKKSLVTSLNYMKDKKGTLLPKSSRFNRTKNVSIAFQKKSFSAEEASSDHLKELEQFSKTSKDLVRHDPKVKTIGTGTKQRQRGNVKVESTLKRVKEIKAKTANSTVGPFKTTSIASGNNNPTPEKSQLNRNYTNATLKESTTLKASSSKKVVQRKYITETDTNSSTSSETSTTSAPSRRKVRPTPNVNTRSRKSSLTNSSVVKSPVAANVPKRNMRFSRRLRNNSFNIFD